MAEYVVEMLNITKEFPGIKANDNVTLTLKKGEIHALLGENGAGKSTLMSMLFGLYKPDAGVIKINGKEVFIANPNVATDLGIGMVHQHFKLVDIFSVTENIILGLEPRKYGVTINRKYASDRVRAISEKYGLSVDPKALIKDISVGMQQRVEILKMLYRDADILIFDEPTAVLTPQEIEELMKIMKDLVAEGKSILLITHKLKEIKAVADRCTVLRRGKYIGTVDVNTTSEKEMAEMMVGREVNFKVDKSVANPKEVVLKVNNICSKNNRKLDAVRNVSFNVRSGEIVGIAGIEGNGQTELVEAITGLREMTNGEILLYNNETSNFVNITNLPIRKRTEVGIGHIPEDRHKFGLVLDYTLEDNFILQEYYKAPFSKNGILNPKAIRENSKELIERFDVRSGRDSISLTRSMSGGNQQKAIIAREVSRSPELLIAIQPTRGLDVGAIEFIHRELISERDKGRAVLLVSLELDEVLNVSDRILVMYEGEIVGELEADKTNEKELGLYMSGSKRGAVNDK